MRQPRLLLHEPLGALVALEPLLTRLELVLVAQMFDEGLPAGEPLAALVTGVQRVAGQVASVGQLHGEASVAVGAHQRADAWNGEQQREQLDYVTFMATRQLLWRLDHN